MPYCLLISLSIPKIFAVNLKSSSKSCWIFDVFAFPNFKGAVPSESCTRCYHPTCARHTAVSLVPGYASRQRGVHPSPAAHVESFTYHTSLAHSFLLRVLFFDQFVSLDVNVIDTVLVVLQVLLELVELLLQHLNVLQVLTKLVRRHERLFVIDPEHEFVTLAHELNQPQRLLQLQSLLLQPLQQQVPQPVQLLQPLLATPHDWRCHALLSPDEQLSVTKCSQYNNTLIKRTISLKHHNNNTRCFIKRCPTAIYRWNFYTGPFWAENFNVRFFAQFSTLGGFFRGYRSILTSNFGSRKGLTLAWDRVVQAIAHENPSGGLTCRSVNKKGIYMLEKFSLYFTHLPRSPQRTDLQEILHRGSSRGRNHLFQILCRLAQGFRICVGSNFAILHWFSRSPLTQGCATARLWCGMLNVNLGWVNMSAHNFFAGGPKFNAGETVLNNAIYSLSISSSVPEILVLKLKSFPKSHQILDVFALPNFKGTVPRNPVPIAHLMACHVAKLHWATPSTPWL